MTAVLFVLLLVVTVIVGLVVGAYAGHCFLLIVQETAAGNNEIGWPDEPFQDWLWKFPYLVWLSGIWILPAVLLLRVLNPPVPAVTPGLWFVVVCVFILWLLFPVSLLSSLSASSRWVVFSPSLLPRLVKLAPVMLYFYGVSGVLLVLGGAAFYAVLGLGWGELLPVAAALGSTVLFIYARLLGRVTLVLSRVRMPAREKPRKAKRRPPPVRKPRAPEPLPAKKSAPLQTPEGLVEGYALTEAEPPSYPPMPSEDEQRGPIQTPEGPVDGYEMSGEEPPPRPREPVPRSPRADYEEALERRHDVFPPPKRPLLFGVFTFPWHSTTLPAWLLLSLGLLALGGVFQMLILQWPL